MSIPPIHERVGLLNCSFIFGLWVVKWLECHSIVILVWYHFRQGWTREHCQFQSTRFLWLVIYLELFFSKIESSLSWIALRFSIIVGPPEQKKRTIYLYAPCWLKVTQRQRRDCGWTEILEHWFWLSDEWESERIGQKGQHTKTKLANYEASYESKG